MMFIPSKYNVVSYLENGKLRLYNSYSGLSSLLEVSEENSERVLFLLNQLKISDDENDEILKVLLQKGYIVSENDSEKNKLQLLRNDVINNRSLSMIILPTEYCNFRCQYCYEQHKKITMSEEVQQRIIKFVSKNISQYTALNVGWFGGEPLEALEVITNLSEAFIDICKVAKKPYRASMTTNGYNLTLPVCHKLMQLNNYRYQITLDGLSKTHDVLRPLENGNGTFDTIINNLKNIRDDSRCRFVNVVLRTNYTRTILSYLEEYLEFLNNEFGGDERFTLAIHLASDWGGDIDDKTKQDFIPSKEYGDLLNLIKASKKQLNFNYHLADLNPYEFKCYAARRNTYVVGADAKIYKCTVDFELPENNIGFINEQGEMIINQSLLAKWLQLDKNIANSKCGECSYGGCCLGSPCPRIAVSSAHIKGDCPRNKNDISTILKLFDSDIFDSI